MRADGDLDLITLGRSSVDLHGEQVRGRLEDVGSFAKHFGGGQVDAAVGVLRRGLGAAPIFVDLAVGRGIGEAPARLWRSGAIDAAKGVETLPTGFRVLVDARRSAKAEALARPAAE
jgi:hypothetical protein